MTNSRLAALLRRLDEAPGVCGHEDPVGDELDRILEGVVDESRVDSIGNRYYTRKGSGGPTLLLGAHMDEIGFIVKWVDPSGLVYLVPAGYHDPRGIVGQAFTAYGEKGPVSGYALSLPTHLLCEESKKTPVELDDVPADFGFRSAAEASEAGVFPGDPVVFDRPGRFLAGRLYSGKAVDDRAGCAVACELFLRLAGEKLGATLVFAGTVQEELGFRGAGNAVRTVKPDLALALDVTFAGPFPGWCAHKLPIALGDGAAIKTYDWSPCSCSGNVTPRRLVKRLEAAAAKAGVKAPREIILNGGTDAGGFVRAGVEAGGISIPVRSLHTPVGTVDLNDLEAAVRLLLEFVRGL